MLQNHGTFLQSTNCQALMSYKRRQYLHFIHQARIVPVSNPQVFSTRFIGNPITPSAVQPHTHIMAPSTAICLMTATVASVFPMPLHTTSAAFLDLILVVKGDWITSAMANGRQRNKMTANEKKIICIRIKSINSSHCIRIEIHFLRQIMLQIIEFLWFHNVIHWSQAGKLCRIKLICFPNREVNSHLCMQSESCGQNTQSESIRSNRMTKSFQHIFWIPGHYS